MCTNIGILEQIIDVVDNLEEIVGGLNIPKNTNKHLVARLISLSRTYS